MTVNNLSNYIHHSGRRRAAMPKLNTHKKSADDNGIVMMRICRHTTCKEGQSR
jgi:hypothetical protein